MATIIPENQARFDLQELVECVQGTLVCRGDSCVNYVQGVSTDTRRVRQGNVFVALSGERYDAHDYVQQAVDAGAKVLISQRDLTLGQEPVAVIRVADTLGALGRMARYHRERWCKNVRAAGASGKVVAVTGSAGKTTTCRAITAVFQHLSNGSVHAPAGNLNNAVGVPMVLLGLEDSHDVAVVEVGTNAPGEVAYGASLAQPDVAVVTLVACAHTLGLGTIDDVAKEKGAIFSCLARGGVAVGNHDDPRVIEQLRVSGASNMMTFGRGEGATVRVMGVKSSGLEGQRLTLQVRVNDTERQVQTSVPLLGDAGVYACSASVAVALATYGDAVDLYDLGHALESIRAEASRLQPRKLACGAVLIDDAYNANPASMRDSIRVAKQLATDDARGLTLVVGEMRELGAQSKLEHEKLGQVLAEAKPDRAIVVGGDACHTARVAQRMGVETRFVTGADQAAQQLLELFANGQGDRDVVLVKASRGIGLEVVVQALDSWSQKSKSSLENKLLHDTGGHAV